MYRPLIAAAACAALAACTPSTPSGGPAAPFIGKTLSSADGTVFLFQPDGRVGGTFRGTAPIVGTYVETGAEICSTYSSPSQLTGREYCSVPAISGDTVVFNRRDGSQSPAYRIDG